MYFITSKDFDEHSGATDAVAAAAAAYVSFAKNTKTLSLSLYPFTRFFRYLLKTHP